MHKTTETVFLTKFDRGYYAEKQPRYEWSFTDNPLLAKQNLTSKILSRS